MTKMKKVIIRDAWAFEPLDSDYEHPTGESMTIPDESFSIQEILVKFSKGLGSDLFRDAQYSDTDDFDKTDPFLSPDYDLSDIDQILSESSDEQSSGELEGGKVIPDITASISEEAEKGEMTEGNTAKKG